jgi:hypothetical protein
MAETADDVSAGRFLPLLPALAYLEQQTGNRDFADTLLRWGLAFGPIPGGAEGHILYRVHATEVHFPDRGKPPAPGRVIVPAPRYDGAWFWRVAPFDEGPEIDYGRSDAIRTDPAVELSDGTWQAPRIVRLRGVVVSVRGLDMVLYSRGLLSKLPPPPVTTEAVTTEASSTSTKPKLPRGKTERWVYDQMEAKPPIADDREYVANLHARCPYEVTQKTIANHVGHYRKQFKLPAEAPVKFPRSSREAPGK